MKNIREARQFVQQLVKDVIVPRLGRQFQVAPEGFFWRVAGKDHVDSAVVGVQHHAGEYRIKLGVFVRYPVFEWLRFLGKPPRGSHLGYNVGLRHFPPPDLPYWLITDSDLATRVISALEQYGLPFYSSMSTPQQVVDQLDNVVRTLFHPGGPEARVCAAAAMRYAYIDQTEAIDSLNAAIQAGSVLGFPFRNTTELLEMRDFLLAAPRVPRLKLRP